MTPEQVREAIVAGFIETGEPLTAAMIAKRLNAPEAAARQLLRTFELDGITYAHMGLYQPAPGLLLQALRASPPNTFTAADAAELGRLFAKARAAEIDPAALPILRGSFQDIRATALWADLAAPAPQAGAAFPLAIDETC